MGMADRFVGLPEADKNAFMTRYLKPAQSHYTGRVETVFTRESRGGGAKLDTVEKIGVAMLKTLNRIAGTLDSILDIMRYQVSFTCTQSPLISC
jgi:hypothetical protein